MDTLGALISGAADRGKAAPFVAACVQAAPVAFDVQKTLEKVGDLTSQSRLSGAKLVLFPEAFISAYPRGTNFGSIVGARSPEGRQQYEMYYRSSIDVPGPAVDALSLIAKQNALFLVIGVIERDGGTLYCAVLYFDDQGRFLAKRRKLMPTGSERLVWGFGDGSTLQVHETSIGRLGAVICWENYMPMLRAAMYAQRIEIYCAPTADARATWLPSMQHIALEGRCFVLTTNQFCRRSDFPDDYVCELTSDPNSVVCRGGAAIIDPLGQVLAGPVWDQEAIITAEIDRGAVTRGLYDFDPVGHYSRPDVFSLSVDTRAKPAVRFE